MTPDAAYRAAHAQVPDEARLAVIDAIPRVVWMAEPDGRVEHVSSRAANRLGINSDNASEWQWLQFVHPDDVAGVRRTWEAAVAAGTDYVNEYRLRHPDGEYRWCLARASAVRGADGQVERWLGTLTDTDDLKRAKEEQARDAAIVSHVRDSIVVTDLEGNVTYWNEGATRLFGWTAEEMLGGQLIRRFLEHQRPAVSDLLRSIVEGQEWSGEFEDSRKDGSRVWIDARIARMCDAGGRPTGILGISHDITARKTAQRERDRVSAQLALQIQRMPLGYFFFDAEFCVTGCNAAAERIFGYSKAEILGIRPPFDKILPVAARQQADDLLQRVRVGDMTAHAINDNLTADGRTIRCEWFNTPLFDEAGVFVGSISLMQDVTDRSRAEEALRASEERFRQIAESIKEVFWLSTVDNRELAYVSPAYETVWGRSRASLYASPESWFDAIHPHDRQGVAQAAATMRTPGGEYDEEYRIVRPDGSIRWIRDRAFPVKGEHDEVVRVAGVAEDVTERRELEEQLQQARKMEAVGQLAGGVAHDFNNLLTIINGYSELLLDSPEQTSASRELIVEIKRAGERSAVLTHQLLAFSRRQVLAPRTMDVNDIVRDIEKMLRQALGEDVTLTTALDDGLGPVRADPGQFRESLLDLTVNARDAMPGGGTFAIATRAVDLDEAYVAEHPGVTAGPYVMIAMTDSGLGMAEEVKRHIFEPFFTTKDPGIGTGLGLAVVHGFVKQSGGHVEVHSEPGHGSCFEIYLPVCAPHERAATTDDAAATPLPGGSETILLVEDQDAVRAFTRRLLQGCGYTVLEAASGEDALRIAGQSSSAIHLLITDLVMPGMGGRGVAEQVLALQPEAKVLYVSGYTSDTVVRQGLLDEQVNFLQKPFSALLLAQKVRRLLAV